MNVKTIFLLFIIILIVFISGCTQEPVCGNGIIESGEECDSNDCPTDKFCTEECKCESLSPPQLPA